MINQVRLEVMQTIEKSMDELLQQFLKPIEKSWQPADFLPDTASDTFAEDLEELQALAKDMSEDLLAVLVGDTITEEALPTYESWLMGVRGISVEERNGWSQWVRSWTAEENRHGDLLSSYLFLCGRVDMKEVQVTTQHLISDGFDIQTGADPYRNFVYTSFQELATNISHRRVATLAKGTGNKQLAKMCGLVAADEARHASAYIEFVRRIFPLDTSEMMLAFEDMMRKKIVMPAHFMRESGQGISELFSHFSDAAQRLQVYTAHDYIDILRSLIQEWDIENMNGLNDNAQRARDYLMNLPNRLERVANRLKVPDTSYPFKWLAA